jgi:hypothetical protein
MAVVVGAAALALGVAVCFYGFKLFPYVVPVGAFLAGSALGAETASAVFGIPPLSTVPSMIVAVAVGLIFAAVSHAYYHWTIIAVAALTGFILGSVWLTGTGHAELGLPGGVALALAFALVAVLLNLPRVLIVSVTAATGALLGLGGILLIGGQISIGRRGFLTTFQAPTLWVLAWVAIAALGAFVQWRTAPRGTAPGS